MALIKLPWIYLPNKDKFGTYFNAKIWIGVADDPNPRTNQKEVRLIQESGNTVIAQQPIRTNAGGLPVFNGAVVALDVTGDYSLAIDDSNDNQKYYFPNNGVTEDLLTSDLRSIMFDLGFVYADIGVKLITATAGTNLDDAEYILNSDTGAVWNLGDEIPAGATVVSLDDDGLLVTSVGSFQLEAKQSDITQGIENQLKGNQNWNVPGADATLTTTPQTITNGDEFTLGWTAYNADIVDIARDSSGITTWLTGTAQYVLPKDLNGLITVDTVKFYVNDGLGNQVEADGTNGLTVSDDASNIYFRINETKGSTGVGFVGWSFFEGVIPAINDIQSSSDAVSKIVDYDYSNPSTGWYREYADGRVVQGGNLPVTSSAIVTFTIPIDSSTVFDANTGINSASVGVANTGIASFTNTQATVYCENAGARQVFWSVEAYKL
jgi:hypothetical protein